ncbi:MAG: hypothetical protein ACJ8M1_07380 [Chthoniobacterales bacterium]
MSDIRWVWLFFSAGFLALVTPSDAAPKTFPLNLKDGKLTGPGAEVLRAELPSAQFILFGEDHGFADSPVLLRAIVREAKPLGFNYHVVEVGPISTRMIDETLGASGVEGLHKLVHEVPLGIPFLSLKDDAELAGDFLGSDSKGGPFLWGVDQEFIGSSLFHLKRLADIAPNDSARASAEKLLNEEKDAAAKGDQSRFLLTRFHDQDFDALEAQFQSQPEARGIIDELKESAAIYQLWMNKHNYENNARRARLLAKNFLTRYQAAANPQPKVVFKMGVEHVALGTTTVNTIDLGTLVTSIAKTNHKTALRIAFLPTGGRNVVFTPKGGNPATVQRYDSPESNEFFSAIQLDIGALPREGWTLVPLEPIRQTLDTKGIDALKTFSRFLLLGYDYVLTTPDAKPGVSLY